MPRLRIYPGMGLKLRLPAQSILRDRGHLQRVVRGAGKHARAVADPELREHVEDAIGDRVPGCAKASGCATGDVRNGARPALDLCAVAAGVLDGYVDCSVDAHGPWDYAGGVLVCGEAGAIVSDVFGRDLIVLDHDARRTPVAAATSALHDALVAARRGFR